MFPKVNESVAMKKILFLSVFFLSLTSLSLAQDAPILDKVTKEVCNEFMLNIYQEIQAYKDKFPELSDFDERALVQDQNGFYSINYQIVDLRIKDADPLYQFSVAIKTMEEGVSKKSGLESTYDDFPVLGLRLLRLVHRQVLWHHLNLEKIIKKNIDQLYAHQGNYLPIQMTLKAAKDTFKTGERIEFQVILENKTNQSFKIKNLNEDTLFFTINHKIWGTKSIDAVKSENKKLILGPDESYQRGFRGESFSLPGRVEIDCTYNLAYKGIMPFGKLRITIE